MMHPIQALFLSHFQKWGQVCIIIVFSFHFIFHYFQQYKPDSVIPILLMGLHHDKKYFHTRFID